MFDTQDRYATFTGLIAEIARLMQKIKNNEMARFGLKGKQVQCLFSLYNEGRGLSLAELAEACEEDRAAVSRTVRELAAQGLVYVDDNHPQKYKKPVRLTKQGVRFAKFVTNRITEVTEISGFGIEPEQREMMYEGLQQVAKNLAKVCESYNEPVEISPEEGAD